MTAKKKHPEKTGPKLLISDRLVLGYAHQLVCQGMKLGTAIRKACKSYPGKPYKAPDGEELDYHVNRLRKAYPAFALRAGETVGVSGHWRKDPKRCPTPTGHAVKS